MKEEFHKAKVKLEGLLNLFNELAHVPHPELFSIGGALFDETGAFGMRFLDALEEGVGARIHFSLLFLLLSHLLVFFLTA